MTMPLSDLLLLTPEIFVLTMACAILVVEAFIGEAVGGPVVMPIDLSGK